MRRRRSRSPQDVQERLIEHLVAGTPARTAAELVGVHRNTAALYYHKLRERITERMADESPFDGEVALDESYFCGYRKGERGRGAAGKGVVFGILQRGGRVFTMVPPDLKRSPIVPIIRCKVEPQAIVYTHGLCLYDTLDVAGFEHHRIDHREQFLGAGGAHINARRTSGATPSAI